MDKQLNFDIESFPKKEILINNTAVNLNVMFFRNR